MILFVLPKFSGGGAERVTINILTELSRRGHTVEIIVFDKGGELFSMVPNGVLIHNLETGTLKKSIISLIKKIRELRPNILFSTFGYINVALLFFDWIFPQKTKIWIREANLPSISLPNNQYPILMKFLYRFLYKKSDVLICSSKVMKDEFISGFSIPESIVKIVPNPVNINFIRSSILPAKRFDNGGVCYVASGRLTYQKGFDRLLRWFSLLNDELATLVIVGEGSDKYALIEQSKSLGVHKQIKFIGFCKNPWEWYAGADSFLLSSRWEGLPNVALEALACGTSVIATHESGGIVEIGNQVKDMVIVHSSTSFIKEMSKVKPNTIKKIKKSLLPEAYHINTSILILEKLLKS